MLAFCVVRLCADYHLTIIRQFHRKHNQIHLRFHDLTVQFHNYIHYIWQIKKKIVDTSWGQDIFIFGPEHYAIYQNLRKNLFHSSPKNLYNAKLNESSLVDCQRGILHFPIMLCAPGGVKGSLWHFVLPPVRLCGPVVSSEVHCCVDDAAVFLLGDNSCQCWRGSVEY